MIEDPDGCIMHMTPEQLFWLCAHSQHETYKKLNFSCVGESTCSDSVLRTLLHGEIGVGLGGYGERAFGSLAHTELVVSLTIKDLEDVLRGAETCAITAALTAPSPSLLWRWIKICPRSWPVITTILPSALGPPLIRFKSFLNIYTVLPFISF